MAIPPYKAHNYAPGLPEEIAAAQQKRGGHEIKKTGQQMFKRIDSTQMHPAKPQAKAAPIRSKYV